MFSIQFFAAIVADNGVPTSAADGADIQAALRGAYPPDEDFLVEFILDGAVAGTPVSAELFVWGQMPRSIAGTTFGFGPLGDADGQLNNAAAITGTGQRIYLKPLINMTMLARVYFEVRNLSADTEATLNLHLRRNPGYAGRPT